MSEYITTYTGLCFHVDDPSPEQICIEDIAHALSLLCRGNGHVKTFWSVGEHCIACAKEAEARGLPDRIVLACLLHDAGECYLSDVPRPIKQALSSYQNTESRLLSMIYEKFLGSDLSKEETDIVKEIDDALLWYDLENLLCGSEEMAPEIHIHLSYEVRPFADVEEEYLDLFYAYSKEKRPVSVCIEELADAFEAMFDGWSQFLNKETGEIISIPNADNEYIDREEEDEEVLEKIETTDGYLRLPDKYEIREKEIMFDFAGEIGGVDGDRLYNALRGKHPYRYFKDTAERLGIIKKYYDFRYDTYCRYAKEWCERFALKCHHRKKC